MFTNQPSHEKQSQLKKHIRLIGIIILCVVLYKIDLQSLINTLHEIDILTLFFAISLNLPLIFLKSLRWNMLLKSQSIIYSYKDSFLVYLSSIYAGVITPGRIGEFIKAFYLKYDKNISISRGMSSIILDRLFDIYILIVLGITGIWKFHIFGSFSNTSFLLILPLLIAPALLIRNGLMEKIFDKMFQLSVLTKVQMTVKEKFEDFYEGMAQMLNLKLFYSLFLTLFCFLIFFIQCHIILRAMNISIDFITITLFISISSIVSLLPVSIAGLGTRDAVLIYLFSIIGLKPEFAVSFAFLIFMTFYVAIGVMGAIALWIKPLDISNTESFADSK